MATEKVIHPPRVQARAQARVVGTSRLSMMPAGFLGECPSVPAFCSGTEDCDVIDPSRSHSQITANRFETFPSEHLTRARHILNARESIVVHRLRPLPAGCASNSQSGVLAELAHEERAVVFLKGDVGIQVTNDFVVQIFHPGV